MNQLNSKMFGTLVRIKDAFYLFPIRLKRLAYHFLKGGQSIIALILFDSNIKENKLALKKMALWWSELLYLVLDIFAIPEIYETLLDWSKFNTRPLSPKEIIIAKTVFKNAINYSRVRIDEHSFIGCKHFHFLYVSFYTINSWGRFRADYLVHELVHIWQFQNFGSAYIPRAIMAINSKEGYNYGGIVSLRVAKDEQKSILDFNYEQQADIVTDYFRLKNGYPPQWGKAVVADLPIYEYFIKTIQNNL